MHFGRNWNHRLIGPKILITSYILWGKLRAELCCKITKIFLCLLDLVLTMVKTPPLRLLLPLPTWTKSSSSSSSSSSSRKRRNTSNKALYDLFTREGVVTPDDGDGRQYVNCFAYVEHSRAMTTANESLGPARKRKVPSLLGCKKIKRDCEKHIRNCGQVKLQVKDQMGLSSRPSKASRPSRVLAQSPAQILQVENPSRQVMENYSMRCPSR
jgi:hypothetical protein